MRVRHLQQYLSREHLLVDEGLDALAGLRIGIDAVHWLRSIKSIKDPFAAAIASLPPGLYAILDTELARFTDRNITAVFVFPGMEAGIHAEEVAANTDLQHPQQLDRAWTHVRRGNLGHASKFFALSTSRVNEDTLITVFHHLRFKGFQALHAPYHSGPQLAHFLRAGSVDMIHGPAGLVLHECRQVIVDLNWQSENFASISLDRLLQHSGLTQDQFFDACLLAGTEDCATHPRIGGSREVGAQGDRSLFSKAIQCAKEAPFQDWAMQLETQESRQAAMDVHASTRTLMRWSPVVQTGNMDVCPLEHAVARQELLPRTRGGGGVPQNLADITGETLPSRFYFLLVNGFVPTKLAQALARGEWFDKTPPLVDTEAYRSMLVGLDEYRNRALGLLAQHLGQSFQSKLIAKWAWWETEPEYGDEERVLEPFLLPNCVPWRVTPEAVERELQRQGVRRVTLKFCLEWHDREYRNNGMLVQDIMFRGEPQHQHSAQSLSALVHLQLLEQLELIQRGGNTRLSFALKGSPAQFVEPCLLALELMKQGMLSSDPFIPGDDERAFPLQVDYPVPPASPQARSRLLLSRVMSLYPMRLKHDMWNSGVDFDLAAFHCLVGALLRTLSQLSSALLCSLLMKDISLMNLVPPGYTSPPPSQDGSSDIQAILPPFMLPRACMGVVCLYFLDYDPDTPGLQHATFAENLAAAFPCCHSPLADLKRAMLFWEELRRIVSTIAVFDHVGTAAMAEQIQNATRLLQERQAVLRVFPDGHDGSQDQPEGEPLYRQVLNEVQPPSPREQPDAEP